MYWWFWLDCDDFWCLSIPALTTQVKTADLDPSRSYLLGSHPHGVLCSGAVSAFATDGRKPTTATFYTYFTTFLGPGWNELFPGLESHLLTLLIQFCVPGHRELVYWFVFFSWNRSWFHKIEMRLQTMGRDHSSQILRKKAIKCTALHNVYMRDYLFRRTEQAGTYFKICHLLYHSTYICPILFSPAEHGEISIFVSLKL